VAKGISVILNLGLLIAVDIWPKAYSLGNLICSRLEFLTAN